MCVQGHTILFKEGLFRPLRPYWSSLVMRFALADFLEFAVTAWRQSTQQTGGYYMPHRAMIWHPIYDDQMLTTAQRRADRDAELPSEWTQEVWDACRKHWKSKCAACGSRKNLQRDHLVAVAHIHCPGKIPTNLVPLCANCNADKSAADLAEWYSQAHGNPTDLIEEIWNWQEFCFERGWR